MHTEEKMFNKETFKFFRKFVICEWRKLEQVTCYNIRNSREAVALDVHISSEQLTVCKPLVCLRTHIKGSLPIRLSPYSNRL